MSKNIFNTLSSLSLNWSLNFIGEDQPAKLGRLSNELKKDIDPNGDGKRVPSGFAYWGILPTEKWRTAVDDNFYSLMKKSIENFPDSWNSIQSDLTDELRHIEKEQFDLHYASLGPGTGEKDSCILRSIINNSKNLFSFQ